MPKLTVGELAQTEDNQTVTVIRVSGTLALVQYRNNRQGLIPGYQLSPLGPKPPSKAVPGSQFKIPADLKQAAMAKANREDKTLTSVIIDLLTQYVNGQQNH